MASLSLKKSDLLNLRTQIYQYDKESATRKLSMLRRNSNHRISTASMLMKYQEMLLFLLAYPDSELVHSQATSEIERINKLSKIILSKTSQKGEVTFAGSGLESSYFIGSFSHAISKWLLNNFPECTSFHSFGDSMASVQELLGMSLLPSETWLLENFGLPVNRWINKSSGVKSNDSLAWILNSMEHPEISPALFDLLFDQLQLYISFKVDKMNAQAFLRAPCGKTYYHESGLVKKVDLNQILRRSIGRPLKLTIEQRTEYIRIARFTLLHLSRETDPISYCSEEGIEVFDLDRGFSIALFYLPLERRNPLDSYIGYMIFKNRIPCGYGGAWVFGNKAKIGLNIFPAFRGGESAFLFSQILKTYKRRFNLRYFEAEPYQIGFENPEGIKSGAFWFYYKLGFRPHQKDLFDLAHKEYTAIKLDPKYKTPHDKLKTLSNSMMFLDTIRSHEKLTELLPDTINTSQVISALIADRFEGDRKLALIFFKTEIRRKSGISSASFKNQIDKKSYNLLVPLIYLLTKKNSITKKEKNALLQLISSKGESTEYNYTRYASKFQSRLQKIMRKV